MFFVGEIDEADMSFPLLASIPRWRALADIRPLGPNPSSESGAALAQLGAATLGATASSTLLRKWQSLNAKLDRFVAMAAA